MKSSLEHTFWIYFSILALDLALTHLLLWRAWKLDPEWLVEKKLPCVRWVGKCQRCFWKFSWQVIKFERHLRTDTLGWYFLGLCWVVKLAAVLAMARIVIHFLALLFGIG